MRHCNKGAPQSISGTAAYNVFNYSSGSDFKCSMPFLEKLFLGQIFIFIDFEAYISIFSIFPMICARAAPMQSFSLWEILPV